jgi:hypothetical protein
LRQSGWIGLLEQCLPQPPPKSNNPLTPVNKVRGFLQGLRCGAKHVTHVADLRRDPLLSELLGIKRVTRPSVCVRVFQGCFTPGHNRACFRRPFGGWGERLPSRPGGDALDLDSTRLWHEDGHPAGVAVGYTRLGTKPCRHPLLAVLSEVRLGAAFWWRAGHSGCANKVGWTAPRRQKFRRLAISARGSPDNLFGQGPMLLDLLQESRRLERLRRLRLGPVHQADPINAGRMDVHGQLDLPVGRRNRGAGQASGWFATCAPQA